MLPLTLSGPHGDLFALLHIPPSHSEVRGWILHVPAFADEMNKARPMISEAAAQLCSKGYVVVIFDLYGTGDSQGEFADASWDKWQDDVLFLADWMRQQGAAEIILWGFRLGCLLAMQLVSDCRLSTTRLLLWQPVCDGRQFMTQFLRLRVAASMMGSQPETVAGLKEDIAHEGFLEVAGYRLSRQMLEQVEAVSLRALPGQQGLQVMWLEVTLDPEKPPTPVVRAVNSHWQEHGVEVAIQHCYGERFWATQELTMAPELIALTHRQLPVDATAGLTGSAALLSALRDQPGQGAAGREPGVTFDCQGDELVGVLHQVTSAPSRGVLLIVGGPQYRVGSHRQFVHFARRLAAAGIPVFRFDYRGMGDSRGLYRGFEWVEQDIASAIDAFINRVPSLREIVLFGLCDAATAACFYAPGDPRVTGLIILNPWVRSVEGEARAMLKHYYLNRLLNPRFWRKLFRGELNVRDSACSLASNLSRARGSEPEPAASQVQATAPVATGPAMQSDPSGGPLAARISAALEAFTGKVLLFISGKDLTAAEFLDSFAASAPMRKALADASRCDLAEADHTFSRESWKDEVAERSLEWLGSW